MAQFICMKYRCLTYQELDIAEDGFIDFLYEHGTNRFEWNILNDQSHVWASNLLEEFSDLIFDNMLKDIEYIKLNAGDELLCFELKSDEYTLIRLKSDNDFHHSINSSSLESDLSKMKCSISNNHYSTSKEKLCFYLLENGGEIGNGNTFTTLKQLRLINQN